MVATLVNTMLSSFTTALTPGFGEVLSKKDTKILNRAYRDYEFIYFYLPIYRICMYGDSLYTIYKNLYNVE